MACVTQLWLPTTLVAAVGADEDGCWLQAQMLARGVELAVQVTDGTNSDRYVAVLEHDGELHIGLADSALADAMAWQDLARLALADASGSPRSWVLDANLGTACLNSAVHALSDSAGACIGLAVSPEKALRWRSLAHQLDLFFCNRAEAVSLSSLPPDSALALLSEALSGLGFNRHVLSDGPGDIAVAEPSAAPVLVPVSTAGVKPGAPARSVNGAGDALAGASLAAWCQGMPLTRAVRERGLPAAQAVLSGQALA